MEQSQFTWQSYLFSRGCLNRFFALINSLSYSFLFLWADLDMGQVNLGASTYPFNPWVSRSWIDLGRLLLWGEEYCIFGISYGERGPLCGLSFFEMKYLWRLLISTCRSWSHRSIGIRSLLISLGFGLKCFWGTTSLRCYIMELTPFVPLWVGWKR